MADIVLYHHTDYMDEINQSGSIIATPIKQWKEGVFTYNMISQPGVSFTQAAVCPSLGEFTFATSL